MTTIEPPIIVDAVGSGAAQVVRLDAPRECTANWRLSLLVPAAVDHLGEF